ncbi:hypothetical protein HZA97_09470 [Candidatus Woesearchaeota archaeon]|nr:hypothetical protein [Candidatus Woesearchaeota archaeon]
MAISPLELMKPSDAETALIKDAEFQIDKFLKGNYQGSGQVTFPLPSFIANLRKPVFEELVGLYTKQKWTVTAGEEDGKKYLKFRHAPPKSGGGSNE